MKLTYQAYQSHAHYSMHESLHTVSRRRLFLDYKTYLDGGRRLKERCIELKAIKYHLIRQRCEQYSVVHVEAYEQNSCMITRVQHSLMTPVKPRRTKKERGRGQNCCLSIAHSLTVLHS